MTGNARGSGPYQPRRYVDTAYAESLLARLSQRDLEIVESVWQVRVASGAQLERLHFHYLSFHTRARTRRLFRMPPTAANPDRPISVERLRQLLRDHYYVGFVTYDGIEYKGRHEPLVTQELFDQVQRILDSHAGSGVRYRTHNHYLKGLLWCGRCKYRLIVQRAQGRHGGVYYYFYCRGRQQGMRPAVHTGRGPGGRGGALLRRRGEPARRVAGPGARRRR
jgi:hypothetical protein